MSEQIPESRFPFALLVASRVHVDDDIDVALGQWLDDYRKGTAGRYGPCVEEAQAAATALELRIAGTVPPPPASASSSAWPMLPVLRGIPRGRR